MQGIEDNGWKLSTEVTGTHGLLKEYQKSVYVAAISSQVGKNSIIKKIMEFLKQVKLSWAERQPFYDVSL